MAADQRQGQDDAWTAARPSQGRDNAGRTVQPSRERDDAWTATRPSQGQDNAGTAARPSREREDAGTAARPSQGQDDAGRTARPSREREDAGTAARPSREREDAGKKSVRSQRKRTGATGAARRSVRRSRVRRVRRVRHLATVATAVIVALGLIGLGLWLLFDTRPEVTVRTYPVEYEALIRIRAADNGIDPAWVASIILAESDYQPEAVSSANAQGLMQLLPDTARWIAGKFDETYEEGCLFDPETNVRYGCWYLGWLYGRFDGDMTCATAAYHAGQGQVDAWLADPACSDDGKTLSRIPFETTDTYVKRVLKYYEKYVQLYADDAPAANA